MVPKMDGFEVIQRIRRHPKTITLPVIFLTAKTQRDSQRHGMDLGAEDYITKPFTRKELLGSIQTRIARKRTQEESMLHYSQMLHSKISFQMPLEFMGPLTKILHASDLLASPEKNTQLVATRQLGKQIYDTALLLMDVSQKFLFLSDLEQRKLNERADTTGQICPSANNLIIEILQDIAVKPSFVVNLKKIEPFSCVMSEEDLFKLCEYTTQFVVSQADIHQPLGLSIIMDPVAGYALVRYSFHLIPIRPSLEEGNQLSEYYQTALEREKLMLARIASLLRSQIQFKLEQTDSAEVLLCLPI